MIIDRIIDRLPIRSTFWKVLTGSILAALVISLGMVAILNLLDFTVSAAIPAVSGAIGGAVYAANATQ